MAVLTSTQLVEVQRGVVGSIKAAGGTVNFVKPQVNSAIQAVEDWFVSNALGLSTAIDTATAPFVFLAAQKKRIIAHWLLMKFKMEGI